MDCQIWENFFQVSFIYYCKILEYFRYSFAVTHLQYFELTVLIKQFVIHVSSFHRLIMNMLSLSLSIFCVKSVKKLNLLQYEKSSLIRLPNNSRLYYFIQMYLPLNKSLISEWSRKILQFTSHCLNNFYWFYIIHAEIVLLYSPFIISYPALSSVFWTGGKKSILT